MPPSPTSPCWRSVAGPPVGAAAEPPGADEEAPDADDGSLCHRGDYAVIEIL